MSLRTAMKAAAVKARQSTTEIQAVCATLEESEAYCVSPTLDGELCGWVVDAADAEGKYGLDTYMLFRANADGAEVERVVHTFAALNRMEEFHEEMGMGRSSV